MTTGKDSVIRALQLLDESQGILDELQSQGMWDERCTRIEMEITSLRAELEARNATSH